MITCVECPQCGEGVEVFVKDGVVCTDSVCTECGNIIEQSTPIEDMKCD